MRVRIKDFFIRNKDRFSAAILGAIVVVVLQDIYERLTTRANTPDSKNISLPNPDARTSIGCLIIHQDKVVGIIEKDGFSIPKGELDYSNNLGYAHEAEKITEEKIGIPVRASGTPRQIKSGDEELLLYRCYFSGGKEERLGKQNDHSRKEPCLTSSLNNVPEPDTLAVLAINPKKLQESMWKFPEHKYEITTFYLEALLETEKRKHGTNPYAFTSTEDVWRQ